MAYGAADSLFALREGEHPSAVDIPLQRQRHLAEYRRGRGLAHLLSKRLPGVDDGAVGGEEAVVPVRGLVGLGDGEAGGAEGGTGVVGRGVADDWAAAGGLAGDPEGGAAHAAGDVAEARSWGEAEGVGEMAEVLEGDEADVVEVVGVVIAGDELLPEPEEGAAAGHRGVDGVVALGDDGGV